MTEDLLSTLRSFCKDDESYLKLRALLQEKTILLADHEKVEQDLLESEEKSRYLLEHANDSIIITDPETHQILATNPIAAERLGYSLEEIKGLTTDDISSDRGIEGLTEIREGLDTNKSWIFQTYHKRKDGLEIPVEISSSEIIYEGKVAFLNFCRDITARKAAEEMLLRKNDELNSFIYKASHDLKGPLASIEGLVDVAKNEVNDEASIRYLDLILKCALRLNSNLMDLLEVTRIQHAGLMPEKFFVEEETRAILSSLNHYHNFQQVDFTIDIDTDNDFISDKKLTRSILQNLLSNAIKYSEGTGRKAKVNFSARIMADGLLFTVEDNGHGIPRNSIDKIFDMFYRAHTFTSGTGLGLYIVKSAVEKLGGKLKVNSEENSGTTVSVYLPCLDPKDHPEYEENPGPGENT